MSQPIKPTMTRMTFLTGYVAVRFSDESVIMINDLTVGYDYDLNERTGEHGLLWGIGKFFNSHDELVIRTTMHPFKSIIIEWLEGLDIAYMTV